jgi:hypothetical protein
MALNSRDVLKLLNAGFTIIRADHNQLLIKYKSKENLHWKTLKNGFTSKASVDREMNKLLEISSIISD